ncbi:acyltransferase [Algoriphagus sp. D3-2-R+10]|uniref:acyltransferase n=1 Tax=Algoriphagus aurantiacus TaxID=3103948 RepID=UPI002B3EFE1F|nr:acyltransferase [Algoriphagus sp. D3-2-R+10]MEB2777499.1 acyltransferase [Algoriphagus sp. D3-2-R+10]
MNVLKFIRHHYRAYKKRKRIDFHTKQAKKVLGGYGDLLKVNFKCLFNDNVFLGKNCHFNGIEIPKGGKVTIGNNFHSGKSCMILSKYHNYEGTKIPYDNTYIVKDVVIEDNVWLGNNVIVLGGITIGEGAIIQAGAVVVSDIPACAIAGGNPAKVFKERDKEHYNTLKKEGRFH